MLLESYRLVNGRVMAAVARGGAFLNGIPRPLMDEYWVRPHPAALIIVEGTNVSAQGRACAFTPAC